MKITKIIFLLFSILIVEILNADCGTTAGFVTRASCTDGGSECAVGNYWTGEYCVTQECGTEAKAIGEALESGVVVKPCYYGSGTEGNFCDYTCYWSGSKCYIDCVSDDTISDDLKVIKDCFFRIKPGKYSICSAGDSIDLTTYRCSSSSLTKFSILFSIFTLFLLIM